jgi:NADH-quinone oxidoreductase E subunit|tara:strand:+ start:1821 stop:2429 length:609 start_codon:yes stop_codon:yes gene_type:complete
MSIKKISKDQPENFKFNDKNLEAAEKVISNYPKGKQQSAVMALLYIAQRQNNNWIPLSAMKYIARYLNMPYIKVYEVATFYTMYNLAPVGEYFFQVCTTTPCMLRGAYKLVDVCKSKISQNENVISKDGKISWMEVECLGACVNSPMIQINDDYFEDLDEKKLEKIIENIQHGQKIKPGSYKGRKSAEPENNRVTLMDSKNA